MKKFLTCFLMIGFSLNPIFAGVTERKPADKDELDKSCNEDGQQSSLNSFLWTLKRDPPSYFFGTIHVPYNRVWDYIPENMKVAFKQSDNIFFELDLTDPYTMTALSNCQLLPHGENLSNILPKDIYTRLKDHLQYIREKMSNWITADQKGKGLYADYLFDIIAGNWERKRPIWVMLLVNSLTESDIKSREIPVLDLYLAQEAERLRKITGAVEKVEEQCVPLNDLNFTQVLFALNQTLWQHESYRLSNSAIPYTTDDLIHHYNCGDLNDIIFNHDSRQVPNLLNASLPPNELKTANIIDNYFRTELINKRNERMSERVAKLLTDHPDESFFFAFGAGHFLGNNTVIDKLRKLGFDIQHTQPDEVIPKLDYDNDWSEQKSPYLSTKSTGYPLSTSVFSGDIEYFVNNRLRLHRRHKGKRKNKIQEEFGDLWDQMDAESRSWLEQTRRERRKKYNSNKPFNDLWIRMETPRPGLMQQLTESDLSNSVLGSQTTPKFVPFLNNGSANSHSVTTTSVMYMLWLVMVHSTLS